MGFGLAALALLAAAAARTDCPSADEVAAKLRGLAPEALDGGQARIALDGGRLVVEAPGRPRLERELPAGDCAARTEAAALVAARHLKSAPTWEPLAPADPGEWVEWAAPVPGTETDAAPATASVADTVPVTEIVTVPESEAGAGGELEPLDTRAEIPKEPPLFRSGGSFTERRTSWIVDPWFAWLSVLGWPDVLARPLSLGVVNRAALFGGPLEPRAPSALRGGALRVESQAGPGSGWGSLVGAELSLGNGFSVPVFYGAAYRDRFYSVDVEIGAQALLELTGTAVGGFQLSFNVGLNGELRARYEVARGVVLWASLGVRTVWPTVGVPGVPGLAGVAGVGLSIDPALIPWR